MARTSKPIRRLTAVELELETAEAGPAIGERDAAPRETRAPARHIPEQMDAPIITGIADHRLVRVPGRPVEQTDPVAGQIQYLASRFGTVISDIEGQASKREVADFREGEAFLRNWSASNILAFGSHLGLIENHVSRIRHEILEDAASRLDALLHSSREFINSFEMWREYVDQSSLLDARIGENRREVISVTEVAAEGLARDVESVDPQISSTLAEYAEIASGVRNKRSVALAVLSALRSINNISVSFTEYIVRVAKDGYASILDNGRALGLLKTICQFFPLAMRLAAGHPDLSWLLSHSDDIRAVCNTLSNLKPAKQH
jgi:hypothetical protein